jgi:HD-GYP domain-containing protein (c-di-GMP phosphodiesterase class II)
MTFLAVTGLVNALASLTLGLFVYLNNRKASLSKAYLNLSLSIIFFSVGYFLWQISTENNAQIFWFKFLVIGVILINPAFLHFVFALTSKLDVNKKFLVICYIVNIFFIISNIVGWFYISFVPKYNSGLWPIPNVFFNFYLFFWFFQVFYGFCYFIIGLKENTGRKLYQIKYCILAGGIGFVGGISNWPMWYNINFPPYLNIFIAVHVSILAIAILRHRLMDIEIIIRETAIFAGIFGFSMGVFILVIAAGEQLLQPYLGGNVWIVPAFSLLIVTFAIRPIEKLIYNIAGKYLFRKKFEYQKTLHDAAEGMSKVRDPKKLLNLIVHIISAKLRLEGVAVLLYDSSQGRYCIKASRGNIKERFISLRQDNALIQWLLEKKTPLALEDVQKWTGDTSVKLSPEVLRTDLEQIEDTMQDLGAAVCVPCFFRDEILGVLVLGEKKTGDFFSHDDLKLFSALADEAAIALKNSQLYFEIDKKAGETETLYKREHKLFMHASIAFAAAIDARDAYTHGHSERVTNISLAVLDYIGPVIEIDENPIFRQRLQVAAVLHDIGKIGVPDDILHKPSKLNPREEKLIQRHPSIGADIVSHIRGLRDLIGGIKYHHERYDGKGYPEGLKAEQIPIMARIISVADTFDAMTSDRPYRKALDIMLAREEIQKNAAAQFDPYIVAAFLKAFEQGKVK